MIKRIGRYKILGVILGGIGGYAYYHFIGCASGTCPISSNPWISTAYGAFIGLLAAPARRKTGEEAQPNPKKEA